MNIDLVLERLFELCKLRNISGTELGKVLKLKKSPLTDWKNKKSKPTLEQLGAICENFGISSDYLLFGKIDYNNSLPDEQELIDNYRKLDKRGQYKLQTIIYDELDRIGIEQESRKTSYAASGWTNVTPKGEQMLQEMYERFEKTAKELKEK